MEKDNKKGNIGLQDSTVKMFEHMDKGLTSQQAYSLEKPDKDPSRQALYKLEQKYKQYALTNPKRVQKASRIVDNVLAGKPLTPNTEEIPSNNAILSIVKEIMDRQYPKVVRNENLNVNVDLSPVDLNSYRNTGE